MNWKRWGLVVGILAVPMGLSSQARIAADVNSLPVVKEAVAPRYPQNACLAIVEGRVKVELTALAGGGLGGTHAEGIPLLQAAAVEAALGWSFEPVKETQKVTLSFVFTVLKEANPDGYESTTTSIFRPPYEVEVRCRPGKVRR